MQLELKPQSIADEKDKQKPTNYLFVSQTNLFIKLRCNHNHGSDVLYLWPIPSSHYIW